MKDPSRAAREGALLVELPLATLVVTGPDRRDWLNGLVTCDVKAVEPGVGAWGLALSKQGKILSDLKTQKGPLLLHVLINKGHGVRQAAEDPVTFHTPPVFAEIGPNGTIVSLKKSSAFKVLPKARGRRSTLLA